MLRIKTLNSLQLFRQMYRTHSKLIPLSKRSFLWNYIQGKYCIVPAHRKDSKDGIHNVATAIRHVSKLNYKPNNGDISWSLFQKAYMEHAEEFKYGLRRVGIRHIVAKLEKEKKIRMHFSIT